MAARDMTLKMFEFAQEDGDESKIFLENWLTCAAPDPPNQIIWANVIYSRCNRLTRNCICWIFAILIIIGAFWLMIIFKNYNDSVVIGAGLLTKCPSEEITIETAYLDW
jgi:hypothetical protein